jgi:hypothetical protein
MMFYLNKKVRVVYTMKMMIGVLFRIYLRMSKSFKQQNYIIKSKKSKNY